MSWFEKLIPSAIQIEGGKKGNVPEGLWSKCTSCEEVLYREDLERNLQVCPKCNHHMVIPVRARLIALMDEGASEIADNLEPVDRLKFKDSKKYTDRIKASQKATGESDALVALAGEIHGQKTVAAGFDFAFMGGSMGSVVGEKFVRCVNHAIETQSALVVFTASGGARMQEALFSLFQMAKTSAALTKLSRHKLPFIVVLTHPTMGGVSASFAMLGDVHIAEPNALIGFAGPRVIEQTVRETLPEGFQRSEFLVEHGAVDAIVDRREQRTYLADVIGMLTQQVA